MLKISNTHNIKIAVIGDIMLDHYMKGNFERISPEAPVPIVDVVSELLTFGGAANVIGNLVTYEVNPILFSVIGDDVAGSELMDLFVQHNVATDGIIIEKNRITTKKSRVIVSSHQMMRIDKETKKSISKESEIRIIELLKNKIDELDVILISDYAKGVLTNSLLSNIFTLARSKNKITIVDPKGKDYSKYLGASIIKPNKKEATEACGMPIGNKQELERAAEKIKAITQCDTLVITLSEEGMAIFDKDVKYIPTKATEVFDVTGAGDTVLASLGLALSSGLNIEEACVFANHAAAIVISKVGSATVKVSEVLDHINKN